MRKFGFSKKEATQIFNRFHAMYKVSNKWVDKKIKKAYDTGFVTGAFNLKLQTPILKQTVYHSSVTPYEAEAEGRSAGNMISGQSYGLLTLRAFGLFMKKVRASKFRLTIAPWATIYDSIYIETPLTIEAINWCNKKLIKEMDNIDGCPELEHPIVKMGAVLCIYYPDWSHEVKIPNGSSKAEIRAILDANDIPYTER